MKLINRKTNEMACFGDGIIDLRKLGCENVAEMIEAGWEDYEEPKVGYIIDPMEEDYVSADNSGYEESNIERAKELGIWFETKEEAEQAVEKLKAWKRLKDKGFRFIEHIDRETGQGMTRYEWDGYVNGEDLDLLFGGEE